MSDHQTRLPGCGLARHLSCSVICSPDAGTLSVVVTGLRCAGLRSCATRTSQSSRARYRSWRLRLRSTWKPAWQPRTTTGQPRRHSRCASPGLPLTSGCQGISQLIDAGRSNYKTLLHHYGRQSEVDGAHPNRPHCRMPRSCWRR